MNAIKKLLQVSIYAISLLGTLLPATLLSETLPKLVTASDIEFLKDLRQEPLPPTGMLAVGLDNSTYSEIRLIDLEKQQALKFNFTTHASNYPFFSSDGNLITFAATISGYDKIFKSTWDGSNSQQITNGPYMYGNPSWTSDDSAIVFFVESFPGKKDIIKATLNQETGSAKMQRLTDYDGRNTTPVQSPTSFELAYSSDRFSPGWDICFLNLQKNTEHCPLGNNNETFCRPRWSPDGKKILFSKGYGSSIDLYQYSIETETSTRLTDLPFKEYDATFSPDGRYIAYSYDPKGDEHYELWLLRLSDKKVFPLLRATGSLRYVSWTGTKTYTTIQEDLCPTNPEKVIPGICGCTLPDIDTDLDSLVDCLDLCPLDKNKTTAGLCGCGHQDYIDSQGGISCNLQATASPTPTPTPLPAPHVFLRKTNKTQRIIILKVINTAACIQSFVMQRSKNFKKYPQVNRHAKIRVNKKLRARFAYTTCDGMLSEWTNWRTFEKRY